MPRRVTTIASLATAALAGAALAAAPAGATPTSSSGNTSTAAVPGVPLSCMAVFQAYSAPGSLYWYEYRNGRATSTRVSSNALGWQPTSNQQLGAAGDGGTSFFSSELATSKGGKLMQIRRDGKMVDGAWSVSQQAQTLQSSGWSGTRALANGPRLYRLHGSTLTRYTLGSQVLPKASVSGAVKVGSRFGGVRTLVYERSGVNNGKTIDVFLATDTSGRLLEYRFERTAPTRWTTKVLKSSGFANVPALTTAPCGTKGRTIGTITDSNAMRVYYDANRSDSRGSDIKGGWTGKSGLTLPAFGQ